MGYQLQNRITVVIEYEVETNQFIEVPIDSGTTLTQMYMVESTKIAIPTLFLQLEDGLLFFTKYALLDGRRIKISLLTSGQAIQQCTFRIFSFQSEFNGKVNTYKIDGYLDCPLYWFATSCQTYRGSSSSVLNQIAVRCGLTYTGDVTHDSQLWVQGNRTNCDFVNYVATHGYKSNTSYMVKCVYLQGALAYKDVNAITSSKYTVVVDDTREGCYVATDINIRANSGLNGANGGYASLMNVNDLSQSASYNSLVTINTERSPNFNTGINQQIKRGIVDFNCLSTDANEHFWAGTYQNFRYSKLYNVECSMMLNTVSELYPLVGVNLSVNETSKTLDTSDSGLYVVNTRTVCVIGVNYGERITCTRKGVN